MALPVPERHPLRVLFSTLCRKNVLGVVRLERPDIADYLGGLLSRFVHVDELRRGPGALGRPPGGGGGEVFQGGREGRGRGLPPAGGGPPAPRRTGKGRGGGKGRTP